MQLNPLIEIIMATKIIKPDLTTYFNAMPFIGRYMAYDYDRANTLNDLIWLFHKWMDESEASINTMRKIHFKSGAYYIYSFLSGKSYESHV